MPKYVIERDIPDAGRMTPQDLQAVARKSCDVLRDMGPRVTWQQSYVTDDKIYCVYFADNPQAVLEHAAAGGFPANKVSLVSTVIDPGTGE